MNKHTLISMVILGITSFIGRDLNAEEQRQVLSSVSGRYVFGQVSQMRADQFLLDTQTGRLWTIVVDDKKVAKLQPVDFLTVYGFEFETPDPPQDVIDFYRKKRAEDKEEKKRKEFTESLMKKNE